jgi:hypothetical protein
MNLHFHSGRPTTGTLEYTARLWWHLAIVLWIFWLVALGSVAAFGG